MQMEKYSTKPEHSPEQDGNFQKRSTLKWVTCCSILRDEARVIPTTISCNSPHSSDCKKFFALLQEIEPDEDSRLQ